MPNNYNLACAIYRHHLDTPDAVAVACQGRSLNYGELAERASRLASSSLSGFLGKPCQMGFTLKN
jgi:non-ribosomal peptide synthetase component F